MSIPEQIRALSSLAAIDAELKVLDEQIAAERAVLSGLRAERDRLDQKLSLDRTALAANEKSRGEQMHEVRSMNQQIEHSREKLGRSRNERESNAAQRELEELRKLLRDREDELGKLTTAAEALRQGIETTDGEAGRIAAELAEKDNEISSRLADVQAARNAKASEREAQQKVLPIPLYRKYETIRAKRGSAVARTREGTCSACYMALPPQLFHRLRREPLIEQCQSCQRLIFFETKPTEPA